MLRIQPTGDEASATVPAVVRGENVAAIDPDQMPTRPLSRLSMQTMRDSAGTGKVWGDWGVRAVRQGYRRTGGKRTAQILGSHAPFSLSMQNLGDSTTGHIRRSTLPVLSRLRIAIVGGR
jgi:hypothetical protein